MKRDICKADELYAHLLEMLNNRFGMDFIAAIALFNDFKRRQAENVRDRHIALIYDQVAEAVAKELPGAAKFLRGKSSAHLHFLEQGEALKEQQHDHVCGALEAALKRLQNPEDPQR